MERTTTFQTIALLVLRLTVAAIFLYAGTAKWIFWSAAPAGMPSGMIHLMQFLSVVEPLGAIALIIGLLTQWAAGGLAIIMVGAVYFVRAAMHAGWFTSPQGSGADYVLIILAGCIALTAFGAGPWSLDAMRKKD